MVPLDTDIRTMPRKGANEAHYIYCDMHHEWAGGVFGQYVPQLQRGMTVTSYNASTYELRNVP